MDNIDRQREDELLGPDQPIAGEEEETVQAQEIEENVVAEEPMEEMEKESKKKSVEDLEATLNTALMAIEEQADHIRLTADHMQAIQIRIQELEKQVEEISQKRHGTAEEGGSPPKRQNCQREVVPAPQLFARPVQAERVQPAREQVEEVEERPQQAVHNRPNIRPNNVDQQAAAANRRRLEEEVGAVRCLYCHGSHWSAMCRNVQNYDDREDIVRVMGRCRICLKRHLGICRSNHRCR